VALYLEKRQKQKPAFKKEDIFCGGYDLLARNVACLQKGHLDFLISQRPRFQGYQAVKAFYQAMILKKNPPNPALNVPIDIITKKNLDSFKGEQL
jgi:LacI family transcriptional regulator